MFNFQAIIPVPTVPTTLYALENQTIDLLQSQYALRQSFTAMDRELMEIRYLDQQFNQATQAKIILTDLNPDKTLLAILNLDNSNSKVPADIQTSTDSKTPPTEKVDEVPGPEDNPVSDEETKNGIDETAEALESLGEALSKAKDWIQTKAKAIVNRIQDIFRNTLDLFRKYDTIVNGLVNDISTATLDPEKYKEKEATVLPYKDWASNVNALLKISDTLYTYLDYVAKSHKKGQFATPGKEFTDMVANLTRAMLGEFEGDDDHHHFSFQKPTVNKLNLASAGWDIKSYSKSNPNTKKLLNLITFYNKKLTEKSKQLLDQVMQLYIYWIRHSEDHEGVANAASDDDFAIRSWVTLIKRHITLSTSCIDQWIHASRQAYACR